MPFLYNITLKEGEGKVLLTSSREIASLIYHDLFDFPLTAGELIKWTLGEKVVVPNWEERQIGNKGAYYFLGKNEAVVYKRILKKRISGRKIKIARKASQVLSLIPTVKMVAITGALAMENALDESDIDLLIIAKKGTLWTTRLIALISLMALRIPIRRFGEKDQKDKLCLNIWLTENTLTWPKKDRNLYTAHEIAQIKPLVDKDKTYEKFLAKNEWVRECWPNAVRISSVLKNGKKIKPTAPAGGFNILEILAFKMQYLYMKSKITREVVTPTRAIFHPNDWGKIVLARLSS
jgi:predicted nucleotidyltransferase